MAAVTFAQSFRQMPLLLLLLLTACTTVVPYRRPANDEEAAKLTEMLHGHEVEIRHGAVSERGVDVIVDPARTIWISDLAQRRSLPTEFISSLRYAPERTPAIEQPGFWISAVAGAALGAFIGYRAGSDTPCPSHQSSDDYAPDYCISLSRGQKAVALGAVLSLVGAGVGAYLLQEREELRFGP